MPAGTTDFNETKKLKMRHFDDLQMDLHSGLHLLKVNDESTLRDAGCFLFGLTEENFGLKYKFLNKFKTIDLSQIY